MFGTNKEVITLKRRPGMNMVISIIMLMKKIFQRRPLVKALLLPRVLNTLVLSLILTGNIKENINIKIIPGIRTSINPRSITKKLTIKFSVTTQASDNSLPILSSGLSLVLLVSNTK
jgi:hypothetical protein